MSSPELPDETPGEEPRELRPFGVDDLLRTVRFEPIGVGQCACVLTLESSTIDDSDMGIPPLAESVIIDGLE